MAIKSSQGFKITSDEAIDANLTLTKLEMKNIDENLIPDKYFTICQDDGKLYLYNKSNSIDETLGKFRLLEGGSGGNAEWGNITGNIDDQIDLLEQLEGKQPTLVSGTNIKTINNHSILGEGNLVIEGGGEATDYGPLLNKPKINSIELIDNKTSSDLGLQPEMDAITNQEIDTIIFG